MTVVFLYYISWRQVRQNVFGIGTIYFKITKQIGICLETSFYMCIVKYYQISGGYCP